MENGAFNPSADMSAYMQMPSGAAPFDYNAMQNQQYQQRIQNGNDPRNGSPAYQNPMYPTQPIIPTKRARPREDSIGASPRQGPGMLPPSRSHTPQQAPYPGFQGAVNGNQTFQAPNNPYHRFSNPGNNANLSPSMQHQQFNPQAPPTRVQTVSPSPFSPAAPNFGSQASPPPQSDHGSRVNTPQNGAGNYMQGMPYGAASNQPFTPPQNGNNVAAQAPLTLQQQQQIRQQRYMQQMQASNAAMQGRYPGMAANPGVNPSHPMANMSAMGGRIPHPQQAGMRPNQHEQLVRTIASMMQQRNLHFDPNPTVLGRPVNLLQLFGMVMKRGGSKAVTQRGQWPSVAQDFQVPPAQCMMAAADLQNYWQNNLVHYEIFYIQNQQRQRAEQMRMQRPPHSGEMPTAQDPYSPLKRMDPQLHDSTQSQANLAQTPGPNGYSTPSKPNGRQQSELHAAQTNGFLTPHHAPMDVMHPSGQNRPPPPIAEQPYASPAQPNRVQIQATTIAKKTKQANQGGDGYPRKPLSREDKYTATRQFFAGEPSLDRHGGLHIGAVKSLGDAVAHARPSMPLLAEMGLIDIRALTLSLRCGIKGEVRLALDTLCVLSREMDLNLAKSDDLADALVECAEEQVELLAENAAEVSDAMLISSYEEMFRCCQTENETFQMPPEYGSLEYDLERAVDRLICITTIFRNLSLFELNCERLASTTVIALLGTVMRYLGTRNMLLRNYNNTLDLSKDLVVYLSNVSQHVDLANKEDAACVLHFLLAFAPSPAPTNSGRDEIYFAPYDPTIHYYLPHAVDSLAKLLAKDEPNRGFFRSIFHADGSSTPAFELLTKAFGLAISVLPPYEVDDQRRDRLKHILLARGPHVVQGLLAAEIIVGLIPASEHSLPLAWLSSQDNFAASLNKMVLMYGTVLPPRGNPRQPTMSPDEKHIYDAIAYRGVAILRKLAERVKDAEGDAKELPWGILPSKETLLTNLMKPHVEMSLLRQIQTYATLDT
ncbi:MAG: hypothetical protein Q9183_000064 [Haloplaca sp. 2 TL-2023]